VSRWNQKLLTLGLKSQIIRLEEVTVEELDVAECKWIGIYKAAGVDLLNVKGGGQDGTYYSKENHKGIENLRSGRLSQSQKKEQKKVAPLCPKGLHSFPENLVLHGKRQIIMCLSCRRLDYKRLPDEERLPIPQKVCMEGGCEREFYGVPGKRGQMYVDSPGYCAMHYQRWRLAKIKETPHAICGELGCGRALSCRGKCAKHYARERYHEKKGV